MRLLNQTLTGRLDGESVNICAKLYTLVILFPSIYLLLSSTQGPKTLWSLKRLTLHANIVWKLLFSNQYCLKIVIFRQYWRPTWGAKILCEWYKMVSETINQRKLRKHHIRKNSKYNNNERIKCRTNTDGIAIETANYHSAKEARYNLQFEPL